MLRAEGYVFGIFGLRSRPSKEGGVIHNTLQRPGLRPRCGSRYVLRSRAPCSNFRCPTEGYVPNMRISALCASTKCEQNSIFDLESCCIIKVEKPRATCESAKSWLCEGSAEISLHPQAKVMFCAKEECQLDVDSARCCVKNALCRTMRCPSGYLARDGAEMFSCQAGHCTVEADLETCCAQDPCANVRCENGGTCTSTDGSCKCAEGFTGSTCAINVDECQGNPCGSHGVCADRVGFYECTCDAGYSGKDCDIADQCVAGEHRPDEGSIKCSASNGIVSGTTGECSCICSNGFEGDDCSVPSTCVAGNSGLPGTIACSTDHGKVKGVTGFCECSCDSGYGGADCTTPQPCVAGVHRPSEGTIDCSPEHGTIGGVAGRCTCTCDKDYQGENCKTPVVKPRATCESAKSWLCEGSAKLVSTRKPSSCSAPKKSASSMWTVPGAA